MTGQRPLHNKLHGITFHPLSMSLVNNKCIAFATEFINITEADITETDMIQGGQFVLRLCLLLIVLMVEAGKMIITAMIFSGNKLQINTLKFKVEQTNVTTNKIREADFCLCMFH